MRVPGTSAGLRGFRHGAAALSALAAGAGYAVLFSFRPENRAELGDATWLFAALLALMVVAPLGWGLAWVALLAPGAAGRRRSAREFRQALLAALEASPDPRRRRLGVALSWRFPDRHALHAAPPGRNAALLRWARGGNDGEAERAGAEMAAWAKPRPCALTQDEDERAFGELGRTVDLQDFHALRARLFVAGQRVADMAGTHDPHEVLAAAISLQVLCDAARAGCRLGGEGERALLALEASLGLPGDRPAPACPMSRHALPGNMRAVLRLALED